MEAAQEDLREVPRDAARVEAVADDSLRLQEYPDFERNFNLQPGIDLDAETDHVMREAELQVAVLSIVPTPQPAAGCPVPAKIHYTREEAYQVLQWQIHRMKQQIREFEEERKREFRKMQPASATPPPAGRLSSSA